ncbi:MAG: hypothetical protein RLZZ362_127 [Actinomycetota bacterium]
MRAFKNFVNGEHVEAADGRTSPVVNPATGAQYATAPVSGAADIDVAMRAAAKAFETWKESPPSERPLALFRIADAVEARAHELIDLEVENCGKPAHLVASEEIPRWSTRSAASPRRHGTSKARAPASTCAA